MKLKPWVHSALHIGCVALLLLQGHRIQKLQMTAAGYKLQMTSARCRLSDEQWRQVRQAADWFAQEDIQQLELLQQHFANCMQSKEALQQHLINCMQSKADSNK
jgi:hypothetical protein